jgi:hypothetical protein
MSDFTDDMRAIDKWGVDYRKATLEGLPLPELVLPSNRKTHAHEEGQSSPVRSDNSLGSPA